MHKCPNCDVEMKAKGEISEDGEIIFYQCPKCKNIQLHARQHNTGLRMTYP